MVHLAQHFRISSWAHRYRNEFVSIHHPLVGEQTELVVLTPTQSSSELHARHMIFHFDVLDGEGDF